MRPQRVRDPLHNIIEFRDGQFEQVLWDVIQTRPFQRLRRIRQLGFSDFVYPGATHTRFAHCIGAFHTARRLMRIITRYIEAQPDMDVQDHQKQVALAAALVHDVGHGMFSHAFEDIGKVLGLKMARHETVTEHLILNSEMADAFAPLGSGFAADVAAVIGQERPGTLYDAVVSSQFDSDRLDYMQRDRLMTGVQNSGIDFSWLIENLEVGEVPIVVDEEKVGTIDTFVLGPKAIHAAETFVVALFQLYPTIYFHKATRAAEKVFSTLMLRLIPMIQEGHVDKTGLPESHPIARFAKDPESLECALALDDSVVWGALSMMAEAKDAAITELAKRLRDRKLPKCIDIRTIVIGSIGDPHRASRDKGEALANEIGRVTTIIEERLQEWSDQNSGDVPRVFVDRGSRDPYKSYQETKGPLNQIRIRTSNNEIMDIAEHSPIIAGIRKFEFFRAYVEGIDNEAKSSVEQIVNQTLRGE